MPLISRAYVGRWFLKSVVLSSPVSRPITLAVWQVFTDADLDQSVIVEILVRNSSWLQVHRYQRLLYAERNFCLL